MAFFNGAACSYAVITPPKYGVVFINFRESSMNYNKNTAISILISIIILAGIILYAKLSNQEPQSRNKSSRKLTRLEYSYDFGEISMSKGPVSHIFRVKNEGNEKLAVSKIYTSCMCTTAVLIKNDERYGPFGMPGHGLVPPVNQSLEAGQEAQIDVSFDPAAHGPAGVGRVERSVFVNGENEQLSELKITATVTP